MLIDKMGSKHQPTSKLIGKTVQSEDKWAGVPACTWLASTSEDTMYAFSLFYVMFQAVVDKIYDSVPTWTWLTLTSEDTMYTLSLFNVAW